MRHKASDKTTAAQKQQIVVQLYNNFFNIAFKDTVEKLGIVYTPVPVVDFIVKSVERVLNKHFKASISDKGVHVIDPFTGTGTFITRLLQSGIIKPKDLLYKYNNEIHANEIVLLAYYIAAINIESVFHDQIADCKFHPFDGIVLTDTFQLGEEETNIPGIFPENSERAAKQKKLDIRVVIGNPPYNVAKGVKYPHLEERIAGTYIAGTEAVNKNSIYNSYIKAFRWASDRIKDEGVVGFVSPSVWLTGNASNGVRAAFTKEFSFVYVFDLRGNQQGTIGDESRREGGKVFDSGCRQPIAITILVKTKKKTPCKIQYFDIGDFLSRQEKLKLIDDYGDVGALEWRDVIPDQHGDWIRKRNKEFDTFIPLAPEKKFDYLTKSFFTVVSRGLETARDAWVYNSSRSVLVKQVASTIEFYNDQIDIVSKGGKPSDDAMKISWSASLLASLQRKEQAVFQPDRIEEALYRPYCKQFVYVGEKMIHRRGQWKEYFPSRVQRNKVICVSGLGGSRESSVIMTDGITDLNILDSGTQCFPLYWYEEVQADTSVMELPGLEKQSGYIKHDAISDFILQEFRKIVGPRVQKEDIFNYVYGALHNPDYRAKFAADLKKQLPRLPLPKNHKEFEKVERIGRELANLHLHYEEIDPWPLDEIAAGKIDYHVEKMAWAKDGKTVRKDMLVVNPSLTLAGIPKEAHEYVVNGRTPLEWLIERYQVSTHAESGIKNDPNKWGEEHNYPEYIVELVKRIVRLSVETVRLVGELGDGKKAAAKDTTQAHPSATPPYWWKSGKWGVASPMPEGGHVVMGLKHKWYEKIEAGFKHEELREVKPFWDAKLAGRKGKELRAVTFMKGQASKEQMTWEVLRVDLRGNYYCLELGKRIA